MEQRSHHFQESQPLVKSSSSNISLKYENEEPQNVAVTLQFLDWQDLYETEKPFQIFIDVPKDAEDPRDTNLVFKSVDVKFHNVRGQSDEFTLDDHGFMYRQHTTAVSDFTDRKVVVDDYLPEVEALLRKEVEGVDRVFFFDWRVCMQDNDILLIVNACLGIG